LHYELLSAFLLLPIYLSKQKEQPEVLTEPEEDAGEMRFKLVEKKTTKHH
jgi:hypothetical protein